MGKFSTGLLAGAMLGIGALLIDKRTVKKAKKLMHDKMHRHSWGL